MAPEDTLTPHEWKATADRNHERLAYGNEGMYGWAADACPVSGSVRGSLYPPLPAAFGNPIVRTVPLFLSKY